MGDQNLDRIRFDFLTTGPVSGRARKLSGNGKSTKHSEPTVRSATPKHNFHTGGLALEPRSIGILTKLCRDGVDMERTKTLTARSTNQRMSGLRQTLAILSTGNGTSSWRCLTFTTRAFTHSLFLSLTTGAGGMMFSHTCQPPPPHEDPCFYFVSS